MEHKRIPFYTVRLTVVSADISGMLSALNTAGISLLYVKHTDELSVDFVIYRKDYKRANALIERSGGSVRANHSPVAMGHIHNLLHRPVLLIGIVLIAILTFYLPTRILFVTVSGNERIPDGEIISAASQCGIRFGASRKEIRSEKVKNTLLSDLPSLKWVGVNTRGCVANISVEEKLESEEKKPVPIVSSIVASRDGVITDMTVTSGTPLCKVGQAVKEGTLLVSGYADCGRCIYATRSEGEIFAQTRHQITAVTPIKALKRGDKGMAKRKYSLIIGKKRINFYKGSGILDTTCVKMYVEHTMTLPGGWKLPVVLAVEELIPGRLSVLSGEQEDTRILLESLAKDYLLDRMIAGELLKDSHEITFSEDAARLEGQYICHEMIGQTRIEEIMYHYGETN